jgi:hypothetical protein
MQILSITYRSKLNIDLELDTLYHIFRNRVGDDIDKIEFDGCKTEVQNGKIIVSKFDNIYNMLNLKFKNIGSIHIFKNGNIKTSTNSSNDLCGLFLNIINEHITLISPPNVYKIIKKNVNYDISNLIMRELTSIEYQHKYLAKLMIKYSFNTKIDLDTIQLPDQFTRIHLDIYFSRLKRMYRFNKCTITIFTNGNVILNGLTSFSDAENTLALIGPITFV